MSNAKIEPLSGDEVDALRALLAAFPTPAATVSDLVEVCGPALAVKAEYDAGWARVDADRARAQEVAALPRGKRSQAFLALPTHIRQLLWSTCLGDRGAQIEWARGLSNAGYERLLEDVAGGATQLAIELSAPVPYCRLGTVGRGYSLRANRVALDPSAPAFAILAEQAPELLDGTHWRGISISPGSWVAMPRAVLEIALTFDDVLKVAIDGEARNAFRGSDPIVIVEGLSARDTLVARLAVARLTGVLPPRAAHE